MSLINSVNDKDKKIISEEEKIKNVINIFCKDISKINILDECGWTPLYRTVIAGDLFASKTLINNGADPNIQCAMGETPLYQAVDMNKLDHVKLLINSGADPNILQEDGFSPLHAAVMRQNILIVKYLLINGGNPNTKTKVYNQSPVHIAIKNNVDPMILLLLVQFNGSLLDRDKFDKRPIDYINSKEMNDAVEKLKFGINQLNDKKLALYPQFQTPKKFNNWEISKVFSNTIRSKSSKKDIIINSKTLLKEPGNLRFNFIETNKKEIINIKEKEEEKENKEPNIKKQRLSFITDSSKKEKEESSYIESEKGENDNIIINDSYFIKNKNNQYQCKIDNFNIIYINNFMKKLKSNNEERKENYKFITKKEKMKSYTTDKKYENEYKNGKNLNLFSLSIEDQKKIINEHSSMTEYKDSLKNNNYLYIKPILSLSDSISKNNINDIEKKKAKEEDDEDEDIKRIFTFMEKDNLNKDKSDIANILKKPIEIEKIKTSTLTLSNINRNHISSLNDDSSLNYLWKFKTIDDEYFLNTKRNSEYNTSINTYSYNIDIVNQNAKYPIYEWLKEIKLICYYNNFLERKIYNLDKLIFNLKNGICNITKKDIEKLGISSPGHIYRIITKMEIDSEKISNKVTSIILGELNRDVNVLKNSVYYCCGCCSIENQSKYYNENIKRYQLEQWLNKLKMNKYKNNFINNGFDLFEFFILQMFSSIPIDDNILKDDISIKNIKDRDFILLQINKDIKYIIKKSERITNTSLNEIILNKDINNNKDKIKEENKNENKGENREENEENSNCLIF